MGDRLEQLNWLGMGRDSWCSTLTCGDAPDSMRSTSSSGTAELRAGKEDEDEDVKCLLDVLREWLQLMLRRALVAGRHAHQQFLWRRRRAEDKKERKGFEVVCGRSHDAGNIDKGLQAGTQSWCSRTADSVEV